LVHVHALSRRAADRPRARRYRLNCLSEGCVKEAVTSTSGERIYCKTHMRERGLMPKERMCQKDDCDKRAQKCAQDGLTRYCKRHMREVGLSPFEIICRCGSRCVLGEAGCICVRRLPAACVCGGCIGCGSSVGAARLPY
jgi:hypothetical protein